MAADDAPMLMSPGGGLPASGPPQTRAQLVALFFASAALQMRDIEQRIEAGGRDPTERERDARILGALAKTLRDLSTFDDAANSEQDDDDDTGPRDIEDFRQQLARKMDELVARRKVRAACGAAAGAAAPLERGLEPVRP